MRVWGLGGLELALVESLSEGAPHPCLPLTPACSPSPQVITSGIAAIVLSRYLPNIPLVRGSSWEGLEG